MYSKNEFSIREVIKNKEKIRASFSVAPQTAKVTAIARDKVLMKVEEALNFWLEDMNRKSVPLDGKVLRQKTLSIYEDFQKKDGKEEKTKSLTASRGWLYRYRNRLKNIKFIGEAASSDEEAATAFPAELQKIIKGVKCDPRQVFNCDETGLFWKKMPNRTYSHKSAKQAPGFKAWKDKLMLVLCGNAAGHMIKPDIVYRAKNPCGLKKKKKKKKLSARLLAT